MNIRESIVVWMAMLAVCALTSTTRGMAQEASPKQPDLTKERLQGKAFRKNGCIDVWDRC